jgi:hypothetical protein
MSTPASAIFENLMCDCSTAKRSQMLLNLLAFVNDHNTRVQFDYQRVERLYQALKSLYMYDVSMPGTKLKTIFYCFSFADFDTFDLFKRIVVYKCDINALRTYYSN